MSSLLSGYHPEDHAHRRVGTHLLGVDGTLRLVAERRPQIEFATTMSRLTAPFDPGPIYFGGADNEAPTPEQVEQHPPCGYLLTADQFDQVRETLELHGVRTWPGRDGGRVVPLAQQSRALIPLLLDARGEYALLAAEPSATCR